MQIIEAIPPYVAPKDFVALDFEIFGMDENRMHRPDNGKFAALSVCCEGDPDTVYLVTNEEDVKDVFERVNDGIFVFHNAQFDVIHGRRWANIPDRNKIWCTMLMEKILWSGYYDSFSLSDLVRRYHSERLEKGVRETFEVEAILTSEQKNYASLDAYWTLRVALKQRDLIKSNRMDAWNVWKDVDMPAMWAFLDFRGFRIDVDEWKNLYEGKRARFDELASTLDFNPNSWQQGVPALKDAGFRGLPNYQEETLLKYIHKFPDTDAARMAKAVLECKKLTKLAGSYGEGWLSYVEQEDDDVHVIYAQHNTIGAKTGRTSVSNPHLHNMPIRHNPEYRKPWIARPGHKLIVADWSAQEVFIHGRITMDEKLISILNSGKDIYIEVAKIFGKNITKDDPYRNTRMKPVVLGTMYGLTSRGMSMRYDVPVDECEDLQNRFRKAFPQSAKWNEKQIKKNDYVETLYGRRFWLNPWHRQKEENAINSPHQGGGSDILKITLGKLHRGWDQACPFGIVHQNHDEIVADVPEKFAEDVRHFIQETMEQVGTDYVDGVVNFRADAKICDNWLQGK